jgi:signal transduction histidine kinase/CheY-like chemotaxis protein
MTSKEMLVRVSRGMFERMGATKRRDAENGSGTAGASPSRALPPAARLYVAAVIAAGSVALVAFFPRTYPQPLMFGVLLICASLTSTWKVNLPISFVSGSTLSVSYAANLMSLLLLGREHALIIAAVGVCVQCTYKTKHTYPVYRTVFSAAAVVITMVATGMVYAWLGGTAAPFDVSTWAKPLVGAVATYFLVNTSLIAGAIALSTNRRFTETWREDFLWSGASFIVAGTAGAVAAVVVARGEHWKAVLLLAPIYLTYRSYQLFVGRLADQRRHTEEIELLHQETIIALEQAREAERALAGEKERLAVTLTEMTRLEEARYQLLQREQAARASAEDANRLKDQFLAVVSHELRTPLNAILGWAEMLRRGTLEGPSRDRASQAIYNGAKRQAQLIEDLLDVSRITSGKLRLDRTVIDLRDVVRDALQIVQPGADVKGIQVTIEADPSITAIYGDGARLQQIVSNLLSNAVKFTPAGGSIHVRLHRAGDTIELIVSDTGQGISQDFLPSVFEPFRQADGSSTRVHSGLGLGLSIVKNLVEAHGGTVSAHSAGEGRGSTFRVRFPVAVCSESLEAIPVDRVRSQHEPTDAIESLEGVSVLVVDDDEHSREVVTAHLQGCQATVLTAASAAHALDVLQQHHVDVLISDIGMPEEDGYGLIRRVRASSAPHLASIPAVALTAFARAEDRQQALQAGFQLHLAKPIDARSLVAAVANLRVLKAA